jgi:hypothetical protein
LNSANTGKRRPAANLSQPVSNASWLGDFTDPGGTNLKAIGNSADKLINDA